MFDDDYYDEGMNYDDDEFFQAFYDSCDESNFDYGSSNRHHLNGYDDEPVYHLTQPGFWRCSVCHGYDDDDEPVYHLTDDWGRTHSFYTERDARIYFYRHEDDFKDQSY